MRFAILFVLGSVLLSVGCMKKTECIGHDCVLPEAVVILDSVVNERIYTSLETNEGKPLSAELVLSPEVNADDFMRYSEMRLDSTSQHIMKVYYISNNQSYVHDNAEYINLESTTLEIVTFGDDLILTY